MKNLNKSLLSSLLVAVFLRPSLALAEANGGKFELTKLLIGETGINQATYGNFAMAYAIGEDIAGIKSTGPTFEVSYGYFSAYASGLAGNYQLLNATVGTTKIVQDGLQVGVPLNAAIQICFTSPLDPSSISNGITVSAVINHLGQTVNAVIPTSFTYIVTGSTVVIMPQIAWPGNSLLDVVANTQLRSIDGFVLGADAHAQFLTVLDPHEENVVLHPLPIALGAGSPAQSNSPALNMDIPLNSFSDYAYILISQDPLHSPLQVNPSDLTAANQKAQATAGAYETPIALEEIAAFNAAGQPMSLAKSMSLSISYTGGQGLLDVGGVPVRSETLSLWVLDNSHSLWVKMPDSRPDAVGVSGSVTQFSVYALMGSPATDASSVFVFPLPWRPHGPGAGTGVGHTGTANDGIHFANLPSECTIKVYTVSGNLVRQLHHSDLSGTPGEEKWDGKTSGGDSVASGVYLWRVESSQDSKNGKLMVIQ